MATMTHKGYKARIEFDEDRGIFHGRIVNIGDVITFEGKSTVQLRKEFAESLRYYEEFCAERGIDPERPYSGRFVVRVEPKLHKSIALAARKEGKSINTWVKSALQQAASLR